MPRLLDVFAREPTMLPGEIAVLAFIIAAFVVFSVTLGWLSRH
jgi:hypothetical protein